MSVLSQLTEFLDQQHIEFSAANRHPDHLTQENKCTYADSFASQLVIYPASESEVSTATKFINDLNKAGATLTIYPVSTGNNWGYGSATPSSADAILMSLHKLNHRPTWLSNKHDTDVPYGKIGGIIRIEAGVTQQQLYDFLAEEQADFWMDATGSSTTSSVLANTLTRGFGHTPAGDHFDHCRGLEVVLASGQTIKTGHAGHENPANVGIHKHGHGPAIEGLFSQSNLGIVTAMYLQLMPAKNKMKKFFVKVNSTADYINVVEALRPLKMSKLLDSQMHCGNAHKGIQAFMKYPFKDANNEVPLPTPLFDKITDQFGISPWTVSGAIYGSDNKEISYKASALKQALKSTNSSLILVSPQQADVASKIINSNIVKRLLPSVHDKFSKQFEILQQIMGLKMGKPTDYFMESVYYRKREMSSNRPLNPDEDNVGLFWLAPIGPMTRETLTLMIDTTTSVSQEFGFDPTLSITLLNENAVDCVISIVFDRSVDGEDQLALACYDKMLSTFNSHGFYSYRSSIRAMQTNSLGMSEDLQTFHRSLKSAADPLDTIALGHYIQ